MMATTNLPLAPWHQEAYSREFWLSQVLQLGLVTVRLNCYLPVFLLASPERLLVGPPTSSSTPSPLLCFTLIFQLSSDPATLLYGRAAAASSAKPPVPRGS